MDNQGIQAQRLNELQQMEQLMQLTSRITDQCFDTCISRPSQGRVSDSDKTCLSYCAANFMQAHIMLVRRTIESMQATEFTEMQ